MDVTAAPDISADEEVRQRPKRSQDWRILQTSRKSSFDDDETTKASSEAGGTGVLQVQQVCH